SLRAPSRGSRCAPPAPRSAQLPGIPWTHSPGSPTPAPSVPQAWAIYKGKYHEGTDKADPSTWKTRLRCALNKSTDFQEVPERSQLDISDPWGNCPCPFTTSSLPWSRVPCQGSLLWLEPNPWPASSRTPVLPPCGGCQQFR
uniref:IRF tryptophan pentad repeat domain-containing protein n=1 Tax=Zonotrichia albicollis TaxID=44394 RepID=A0A8D2M801_ZONAL